MKKTTITIGLLTALCSTVMAQQHNETVKKELQFEQKSQNNVLYLANISGHMEVEGYDGDIIQIEANMRLKAKTEKRMEEAKEAIKVAVIDRMDTLIVYTTNKCSTFGKRSNDRKHKRGWGYNWNSYSKGCDHNFDYKVDYKVKVPHNVNLVVSTVNDGDVTITGVDGEVKAHNVNGSITFSSVSNATYANTINGDVTLDFKANPKRDGRFYSLNGDIRANYLKGLSADMSFKSYNGDFYTNISGLEQLPTKIKIDKAGKGRGIAYKLDGKSMMRARNGGVYLDFETFNGDVYVKENN